MTTVVHLSTAHAADDTRIFHKELQTLAAHGYDCHYVLFDDGATRVRDGVTIHPLGVRNSRPDRWRDLDQLYAVATGLDADVYHLHDWDLLPVGIALQLRTAGRVIYDAHEDYPHLINDRDWIPEYTRPVVDAIFPRFEALASNYFDGVIAATEWVEESLHSRGVTDVTTVHNYPQTANLSAGTAGKTLDDSEFTLVYTGGLSEIRGLPDMIELLGELRDRGYDVSLVCLGEFISEQTERDARSRIRELGIEDAVAFPGYVDYQLMFQYLAAADIGLALLDVEHYRGGIPTKLFEYMYSELPVVISDIQATDRYVSPEWGRIVAKTDTEAQTAVVSELLDKPELRAQMGKAGREAVESRFSWESEEAILLSFYDKLIGLI